MRCVARQAALVRLHRSMLEDKRPHGVCMAFGADGELSGSGAHLAAGLSAMRVMAVAALDQSDIDAVPVRPGELGSLRSMAAVAQCGLRLDQQKIDILGMVRTMTRGATDTVREVCRVGKVLRLQAGLMALCANGRGFGRTQVLEADDLGYIAAAIHVRLAWTVARLAAMLVAFQKRRVGRTGKVLVPDFLVAGLANIRVRITGRLGIRNQGGSLRLGRFLLRFVRTSPKCAADAKEC